MGKKDQERAEKGEVYRSGNLINKMALNVANKAIKKYGSASANKEIVINQMIDAWKKENRSKGKDYISKLNVNDELYKAQAKLNSNGEVKKLADAIGLTTADLKEAMEITLHDLREEFDIAQPIVEETKDSMLGDKTFVQSDGGGAVLEKDPCIISDGVMGEGKTQNNLKEETKKKKPFWKR